MSLAVQRGDRVAFMRSDSEFHNTFIENCGNKYLIKAYRLISGQVDALRGHARTVDLNHALKEHQDISTAIGSNHLAEAKATLSEHILRMQVVYILSARSGPIDGVATRGIGTFG